jgi:transposase
MKTTKNKRMFERYQALYLYKTGYNREEIASIIGRSTRSVNSYISAYLRNGIEGLQMQRQSGCPRKLTPDQESQLVEVITTKVPNDVGFTSKYSWTLKIITSYVEREFGPTYTLRGMSYVLHKLNLSYTKPSYTLANGDPIKQEQFKNETFPVLKKN